MDDLGLEDEVEVDFDGRKPPVVFPCENEPQDSLAEQTVSYLPHKRSGVAFLADIRLWPARIPTEDLTLAMLVMMGMMTQMTMMTMMAMITMMSRMI